MRFPDNRLAPPRSRRPLLIVIALMLLALSLGVTAAVPSTEADSTGTPAQTEAAGFSETEWEEEGEGEELEGEEEFEDEEEEDEFGTEGTVLLPSECLLHTAEARVTASTAHNLVRLTMRYTSYTPTNVTVDLWLKGGKGSLQLEEKSPHLSQQGTFRESEHISDRAMDKVQAARTFIVKLDIPAAPSYCDRYSTQRLTARHVAGDQTTWSRQR